MGDRNDIFISYAEEDDVVVTQLALALESSGIAVWYYQRDTIPGMGYGEQVSHAIVNAKVIILIISQNSLMSKQVEGEIFIAHEENKRIIPLLIGISHAEFQQMKPGWRIVLADTSSIPISVVDLTKAIPRVVKGVEYLLHSLSLKDTAWKERVQDANIQRYLLFRLLFSRKSVFRVLSASVVVSVLFTGLVITKEKLTYIVFGPISTPMSPAMLTLPEQEAMVPVRLLVDAHLSFSRGGMRSPVFDTDEAYIATVFSSAMAKNIYRFNKYLYTDCFDSFQIHKEKTASHSVRDEDSFQPQKENKDLEILLNTAICKYMARLAFEYLSRLHMGYGSSESFIKSTR